ncbi:DUF4439 domain-containing protein [Nocardioides sp.]|uniref:DUF4439 domain-containing protein n=1 Tax=Nocardioides sp. TaxID=35761 RepID=UPI0035294622
MTEVDALQSTLEAEHAAVFVFGALVGRLDATAGPAPALAAALGAAYGEHRGRRDELAALIRDAGAVPVAPAPAYALPSRLSTVAQIRRAAVLAEAAASEAYAAQVAAATDADRSWAISALTDSAVRQLTLGGAATPFPGAPELG